MDSGATICVSISIDPEARSATVDFAGTSAQVRRCCRPSQLCWKCACQSCIFYGPHLGIITWNKLAHVNQKATGMKKPVERGYLPARFRSFTCSHTTHVGCLFDEDRHTNPTSHTTLNPGVNESAILANTQLDSNFNAPSAVVRAAVMYVFRTLVDDDIPMNEGCLKPIELKIPQGSMLNPVYPAAVVAGNVETSQVVTDALYGALQVLSLGVHCRSVAIGLEAHSHGERVNV
jgi:hypothetical protein